jgi:glutamyl-tRNA reductase
MSLLVLGINHNTAGLSLRERVAFAPENMGEALAMVCEQQHVDEAVILSTCNRTEVYLAGEASLCERDILQWLADHHDLPLGELADCHYYHRDEDAVRHLMKVAAGLDSLVLGEPQILGQLKSAYAVAEQHGTLSGRLHRAFQRVFAAAKQVRSETAIGQNPVSVAYAAVALARQIFSDLSRSHALLIGAGKTIELVARHLKEAGVCHLTVANRNLSNARTLMEKLGGEAILLSEISEHLHKADIVISSTASQLPILGKGAVEKALRTRKNKLMLMIDIAVPRDIEAEVAELDGVYLYTVDDLREVIDENLKSREAAAEDAYRIIDAALDQYSQELKTVSAVEVIRQYRDQAEDLRLKEIEKARVGLERGDTPEQIMEVLSRNLVNKLLHQPTIQLRKAGAEERSDLLAWARELLIRDANEMQE